MMMSEVITLWDVSRLTEIEYIPKARDMLFCEFINSIRNIGIVVQNDITGKIPGVYLRCEVCPYLDVCLQLVGVGFDIKDL